MDSNFQNAIESLNQITKIDDDFHIDTVQLELAQRKFEVELITKRKQVNQLREEVDSQNQTNHDLKKNLDLANAKLTNLEAEVRARKQSFDAAEADSKNRLLVDKKLQYEITVNENASLKELLQKSEAEKRKLQRQVDDLISQQTIHTTNMNELLQQDQKIRSMIEKYTATFEEMDKEKEKVIELYSGLGEFQQYQHQIELLKGKIETYNLKIDQMEEQHAFDKAKLNMLEELLQNYSLPQPSESTGLQEYLQHREHIEDLERHLKTERELILKQQERLNKEISANVRLCSIVANLEKKVQELEKELADSKINNNAEK